MVIGIFICGSFVLLHIQSKVFSLGVRQFSKVYCADTAERWYQAHLAVRGIDVFLAVSTVQIDAWVKLKMRKLAKIS
ncbi:hypothetical protein, partial [Neglectibacter sp. 59]|uniref:hypothetical protein n=1 Tax=Neglectibacter sp. 59 TaxID=2304573 RepID=UPI0013699370